MRIAARKRLLLIALFSATILFGVALIIPFSRFYLRLGYLKTRALFEITNVDLTPARERWKAVLGPETKLPLPDCRIAIEKSTRKLEIYSGDKLVKTYKVALGQQPTGPKTVKGDSRTPEGEYRICTRIASVFHLFLGLNYPNSTDADFAFGNSTLDSAARDAITKAETDRQKPDWNGPLGGAIGIHGGGAEYDWTGGCIAVARDDIEDIFVATDYWTPVTISP